jgi:hypothetical protein
METVFTMNSGEVGVAVNNPKTDVYVVRVVAKSPPEEILREKYIAGGMDFSVMHIAMSERSQVYLDWYEDLEKELKVTWARSGPVRNIVSASRNE